MKPLKPELLKPGLKALYYSRVHRLLAPVAQGIGLIFMLHRVSPASPRPFSPNQLLTVTPDFLDSVLGQVREADLDIVSIDEAWERIRAGGGDRRFVCITLDDGYRDNMEHAYPVFRRHGAPFTIYVPSDFPEGRGNLWWFALEAVIARQSQIEITADTHLGVMRTRTTGEKNAAYERLYRWYRQGDPDARRAAMHDICERYGVDPEALCRELIMNWEEIRELASDPLVTIGAHTVTHSPLAKLEEDRARAEMKRGADRLEKELGARPAHLSYPYGDADSAGPREFETAGELGFKTAVTTRKGVLFPEHANYLTALPRVSLNGNYQSLVYTSLYLSGAPFALWNRFRKVDAA